MGRGEIPGAQRSAPFRSMLRATDLPSNLNLPPTPHADPTRWVVKQKKAGQKRTDQDGAHDNPAQGAFVEGTVTTPVNVKQAHQIRATQAMHQRRRDACHKGEAEARSGFGTPPTQGEGSPVNHPPCPTGAPKTITGGETGSTVPTGKAPAGGERKHRAHATTLLPRGCNRLHQPPR